MKIDTKLPNGGKLLADFLSKMSEEELHSSHLESTEKLREAKEKLRIARAGARSSGDYSKAGAYAALVAAERVRIIQLAAIATEFGRRKRERNAARDERPNSPLGGDDFTRAFYRAARERLSPALVKNLRDRADEIVTEELGAGK